MIELSELLARMPLVPYIRQSDFAIRGPGWTQRERRLLDYLIIYVQEGVLLVTTEEGPERFEAGSLCLLQPNTWHTLEGLTATITPFAHLDLFYHPRREESFATIGQTDLSPYGDLLQPRLDELDGIGRIPVRIEPDNPVHFRDALLRMVNHWQSDSPLSRLEAQHEAMELALALLRKYGAALKRSTDSPASLNWITSYFSFRLAEPLSIGEMARRAHLSPSRFSALFKAKFGMPPHRYLRQLRIRHGETLLRTTSLQLSAIAEYCGFADLHHFSKVFRAEYGMSPGRYRAAAENESRPGE